MLKNLKNEYVMFLNGQTLRGEPTAEMQEPVRKLTAYHVSFGPKPG
jgi:hypothetical protein